MKPQVESHSSKTCFDKAKLIGRTQIQTKVLRRIFFLVLCSSSQGCFNPGSCGLQGQMSDTFFFAFVN